MDGEEVGVRAQWSHQCRCQHLGEGLRSWSGRVGGDSGWHLGGRTDESVPAWQVLNTASAGWEHAGPGTFLWSRLGLAVGR